MSQQPANKEDIVSSGDSGTSSQEVVSAGQTIEAVDVLGADGNLGAVDPAAVAADNTNKTPVIPVQNSTAPPVSGGAAAAAGKPTAAQEKSEKKGGIVGLIREVVELIVVTVFLLIVIRWAFAEARYIPSSSMEPTLQIEDRLLVEKLSGHLGKPIRRGDILVFYPPPSEMGGKDLSNDPLTVLGRLTGLPFLPYEPAFIKRVVGLPGDKIRVQRDVGVFINEQLLDEPYFKERPNYDLNTLADIGGKGVGGSSMRPFADSKEPIIVPAGQLFMMGDNRNNSEDSHVWGFLDQQRVIGRACLLFWRWLEPPKYPRSIEIFE